MYCRRTISIWLNYSVCSLRVDWCCIGKKCNVYTNDIWNVYKSNEILNGKVIDVRYMYTKLCYIITWHHMSLFNFCQGLLLSVSGWLMSRLSSDSLCFDARNDSGWVVCSIRPMQRQIIHHTLTRFQRLHFLFSPVNMTGFMAPCIWIYCHSKYSSCYKTDKFLRDHLVHVHVQYFIMSYLFYSVDSIVL